MVLSERVMELNEACNILSPVSSNWFVFYPASACRILFCVTLLAFVKVAAAQWPEFRGPTGQGISSARHVPVDWSTNRNVAWKQALRGRGWSSPVLANGRIFLTSSVDKISRPGQSLRVSCRSAATGERLWMTEVFSNEAPYLGHRKNTAASPTPVVAGERIYAHFGELGTACLDLAGNVLWTNRSFSYPSRHGNGGSPVLVEDALIFNADGKTNPCVVALSKHTGGLLWKFNRPTTARKKYSFSTPLVIEVKGKRQVVSPGSGMVNSLDPLTGEEVWRVRYDEGFSVVPRPVFGHGFIYAFSGDDSPPMLLAIRAGGAGDITDTHVAWKSTRGVPVTPSPLLVGDELYLVSDRGTVTCMDAHTGQVHYQETVTKGCSASPILADGKIYIFGEQGRGVVLKPGRQFTKLAENHLHERTLASPAVTDGALFIRTEHHLFCIGKPEAPSSDRIGK